MGEFQDRYGPVALVTGASSGIGRGFAEELAARGLDLVITARRRERLEELAARLQAQHGVKVDVVVADLSEAGAPQLLADATTGHDIGLVVSNAGFSVRGYHETLNPAELTEMLMVDCHAPLHLSHRFLPRLKARGAEGRGSGLVMVSSIEALMGCPFSAAYAAMKALVVHLGEGLFAEAAAAESGVDVLTTCPGATDTEAGLRAGIDMSKIPNLQDPRELAVITLDNLRNGPTCFPNAAYKAQFDQMLAMPRADALRAMAQGMKAAMKG
jgi:short-subunit dehydrogenase